MASPFSPTTPRFCKAIDTSRDKKLIIPKKFLKECWVELPNLAFLKLPNGFEWPVEVRKWDGKVWFENGWPEFSEFFALGCGHWLVFEYQAHSIFNVFIFDRSCTEIDYPLEMPEMEEAGQHSDSDDDLDDYSTYRVKSSVPCPRPPKKNRTSSRGKYHSPAKDHGEGTSNTRKAMALDRAEVFKSQNPSSFHVAMKPTYIHASYLHLPSEIRNLPLAKDCSKATLRVSDGTSWTVCLKYVKERSSFCMQRGWNRFVRQYRLEIDDVCVFVLNTSNAQPLFDVVIFRAYETEEDCVEILDDFPPCPKPKRSPIAAQSQKKNRTRSIGVQKQ